MRLLRLVLTGVLAATVGVTGFAAAPALGFAPPVFTIQCHSGGGHATTVTLTGSTARAQTATGPTKRSARKDPAAACIGQLEANAYQAAVATATAQLQARGATCGTILVPGSDTTTFRLGANGSESEYTGPRADPRASPLPAPCVTITAAEPAKIPSVRWVSCEISPLSAAVYVRSRRTPSAQCAAHGQKLWSKR